MTQQSKILIVEDEPVTRATLASYLDAQGMVVETAATAEEADQLLEQSEFDCLILDINLEGKDGLQITREQRAKSEVGIILVTGLSDDVDRIVGLELGADDYVCKPFNRRELLARIKNLLRRTKAARQNTRKVLRFEGFEFDVVRRKLEDKNGEIVPLTRAEYEVLNLLVRKPGEVVDRDALMQIVTHRQFDTNPRTVDVLIRGCGRRWRSIPPPPD